ncbi:MAG: hypothetical protein ABI581_08090 [Sediminibacterium sp.]
MPSSRRGFMKFNYKDEFFDKKIGYGFIEKHKVGDSIFLKHIEGVDIFLFENEKIEKEFSASILLALVGLYFIIRGFKRK